MNRIFLLGVGVAFIFSNFQQARADVHADLRSGQILTRAQAADLEATVATNQNDLQLRTKLLGHYFTRQFGPEKDAKEARRKHILWIIENHPEAEVASMPQLSLDRNMDPEAYAQGKQLWLDQIKKHPDNAKILGNGAQFFLLHDRKEAERLLQEAQRLEPDNTQWAARLGQLYQLYGGNSNKEKKASAVKALEQFERAQSGAPSEAAKFYQLADLAKAAYSAGDLDKATKYSNELLDRSRDFPTDWNYGNAIHHGNLILGRIALQRGDKEKAIEYLRKAGGTKGSPQLDSFGPNMTLAKELLEKGETKAVLEYFELCRRFWKRGELDRWKKEIEEGKTPAFGGNLSY